MLFTIYSKLSLSDPVINYTHLNSETKLIFYHTVHQVEWRDD